MNYDWNFSVLRQPEYLRLLAGGLGTTLSLTLWCIALGTPLGVISGFLAYVDQFTPSLARPRSLRLQPHRLSGVRTFRVFLLLVSRVTIFAIDAIRAIPLLLLILTSYYVLPVLIGSIMTRLASSSGHVHNQVSSYTCVVIAMTVNLAAFIAELVRGSAIATSRGDIMAARSLGMPQFLTFRRIVLPQVFREILPGLATLYITMLKMSTLASTVAVYEILHSADAIVQKTYHPLELYVSICVIFLALVMPLAYGARRLERSRAFMRRS